MASERVIWKFPIPSPKCTVEMPDKAELVGFGHQDGQLVVWASVDPTEIRVGRLFEVVGTGHEHRAGLTHRGLVQMPDGLVWHLLEDA